jgi:cytochrome c-type biogenesis protein CcmH
MRRLVLAAALLLVWLPSVVRADPLDEGVRRVAVQLQCPVCEGENVADSPSGLASDMRAVIRSKLGAGEADQQILDEFVASYGDSILTEPPKHGISLGVWVGPVVAVAFGAVVLSVLLRSWRRPVGPARGNATSLVLDSDAASEFQRFREELGR